MRFVITALRIAAGNPDRGIRQQQADGVIEARVNLRACGTEGVGSRIVKVSFQAGGGGVFVIEGAADRKDPAIGENRGIHFNPGLRHVGAVDPLRRSGREVNDFASVGGGAAAPHDQHFGRVVVGGS